MANLKNKNKIEVSGPNQNKNKIYWPTGPFMTSLRLNMPCRTYFHGPNQNKNKNKI